MTTRLCDRCSQPIEGQDLRYIAKIQVFAAYDPMAITFEDLTRDHTQEIKEILRHCEGLTEEKLMQDVYVEFQFDLCRACQRAYIKEPLPPVDEAG